MVSLCPELSNTDDGATASDQGEYIFVIDRSYSMGGNSIEHAKQTLLLFIKSLPVDSLFNIIGFGNSFEALFNQ